ncbi:uncharacterized protein LOC122511974 isoform X2 [Leptopilina heterotoma]|uniref:uncharacterized protein LOC122511974 isoform X2 n=1 Tax=Leptopilina heterotoma TaxID=63436 RepID=UPI001CA7CE32|nr:uncharacterized protein LOC122511974 isoform X2 [Leptopilina heterotoma]
MTKNRSLRNFFVISYILSTWSNSVVIAMDELNNLEKLPNFSLDELENLGIEFQESDFDKLKEFFPDSEESRNEGTLTSLQVKLLKKWDINVNINDLSHITNKYFNSSSKMIRKLMTLILGENMLQNMTIRKKLRFDKRYNSIPENVQNFVLVSELCKYIRLKNRGMKSLKASANNVPLTPLQDYLLNKWNIDVNIKNLTLITKKYTARPSAMIRNLMKIILGENMLQNMSIQERKRFCTMYNPIPENVKKFVFEYVNSHAQETISNSTFVKVVSQLCTDMRSVKRVKESLKVSANDVLLTPLQVDLLHKWNIYVNIKNLTLITKKYTARPSAMIRNLMKIILGENVLQKMSMQGEKRVYPKYIPIPENVKNFVFEYVNSHAQERINNSTFVKIVSQLCCNMRQKDSDMPLRTAQLQRGL